MGESNNLLSRILSHGPSQSTVLLILAKIKEDGRPNEVIDECCRALKIYPDDIRLKYLLADTYLEMGFFDKAEAQLDSVTSDIDELISAYKLQARTYKCQKRDKEASNALQIYLAHKPDDQEAIDLLNTIMPAEQQTELEIPKPVQASVEPSEHDDEFPEISTPTLAEIYYEQGQIHTAITTYEQILSNRPQDKNVNQRLAELRAMVGHNVGPAGKADNNLKKKNEKIITVLEGWLSRIKELRYA